MLGLSVWRSGEERVDVCVLTRQVLLGGVGSGLRARGHLHLRAEHGGRGLGALLSGRGSARPPRGAGAAPVSLDHKDAAETDASCLLRGFIWASVGSEGFGCGAEEGVLMSWDAPNRRPRAGGLRQQPSIPAVPGAGV